MKLLPSKHQSLYLTRLGQWCHLRSASLLGLLLAFLLHALVAPAAYAATLTINSLTDTQAELPVMAMWRKTTRVTTCGGL